MPTIDSLTGADFAGVSINQFSVGSVGDTLYLNYSVTAGSFSAVPEPGSLGLIGLAGMAGCLRRRRRRPETRARLLQAA